MLTVPCAENENRSLWIQDLGAWKPLPSLLLGFLPGKEGYIWVLKSPCTGDNMV